MADMSVSGIASGINWDEMIAKILDKAKKPALVMVEKRDKLTRKQEYFEEFQIALQKLNSALSPLKLPSTYKAKGLEIERGDVPGEVQGEVRGCLYDGRSGLWTKRHRARQGRCG